MATQLKNQIKKPAVQIKGFAQGVGNLLWSLKTMMSNKTIFLLSMLTILLNFLVFGGLISLGWSFKAKSVDLIGTKLPFFNSHQMFASVLEWVMFAFWILLCIFVAVAVASIISGPLLDIISEKTEEIMTGHVSPRPFFVVETIKESFIICRLAARGLFVGLLSTVLLGWIPVVGQVAPLCITAHFVTLNFMQPVLARYGISYQERLAFCRQKLGALLGFGLPTQLIPFLLLPFLTPALVIGGTRLYLASVKSELR